MTQFLNRRNVLHKTCFEVKPSKLLTASSLNSTSETTTTTLSSNLKKSAIATTTTTTTRQTCFYLFSDDVKKAQSMMIYRSKTARTQLLFRETALQICSF